MVMKMKAAVLHELGKPVKVEDVTLDEPQANEVLVKVAATGVCHTDLHFIKGDMPQPLPVVLGHEGAGVVEKVGPGVTTLKPGDHVVMMVIYSCGKCRYCTEGQPAMCQEWLGYHLMGTLPGGSKRLHKDGQELNHFFNQSSFAEYAVVNERTAIKIRDDAPLDVVCLLGCGTSTGIGSVINTAAFRAGQTIAVFGCGGVGLSAIMAAKLSGAAKIFAVDTNDMKLEKARELGAEYVINASKEDPVQRIVALAGGGLSYAGGGVDHAIECTGNVTVMAQAFNSIHNGGLCVVAGMAPLGAMLSIEPWGFNLGKCIKGSIQGHIRATLDIPRYVDLYMGGKLPIDKLVSKRYKGLSNINEVLSDLENGKVVRGVVVF
jgi:S-(hydroxymethyl)glutathione dehydrogenase/alcohol dehydrogenase